MPYRQLNRKTTPLKERQVSGKAMDETQLRQCFDGKSILLKTVDIAKIIDGDMRFPEDSAEKC